MIVGAMDETPRDHRPLPQSFRTWLDLSAADEVIELLTLVVAALERKGYVVASAVKRLP